MNNSVDSDVKQISSSCVEWWSSLVCSLRFDLFHKVSPMSKLWSEHGWLPHGWLMLGDLAGGGLGEIFGSGSTALPLEAE